MLRDAAGRLGVAAGVPEHHADLRRRVLARPVQVDRELLARDAADGAQLDLLAEQRRLVVDDGGHRGGARGRVVAGGDVRRRGRVDGLAHALRAPDEALVLGDVVGLARQLDQGRGAVGRRRRHEAGGGGAASALLDALQALDPQDLDGPLHVAVGLDQGVLAVQHAGSEPVAQGLHVSGGVGRHG